MRKFLFTFLTAAFLLSAVNIHSQQNPSDIEWKSIDTGTYLIIFPEEITPLGQRVANLMEHYKEYNYSSIKTKPKRSTIVLTNRYAESNGFVSFAPYMSYWFTTPSSFTGIEWFQGLAIHEGRHMVQMNKVEENSCLQFLFGDFGPAAFTVLFIPAWFNEGDSVLMETALTGAGRGRLPYFNLWHRGLELSNDRYSYYKSYLGSYEAQYPYADHYRLGYFLSAYTRKHYGKMIWNKVMENTHFSFRGGFDSAMSRNTGKGIDEIYGETMDEFRYLWEEQLKSLAMTDAEIVSPEAEIDEKPYTANLDLLFIHFSKRINNPGWDSYLFPFIGNDGKLNAVNYSNEKKLSLIKIENKMKSEKISTLPYDILNQFLMNERPLTSGSGILLWKENVPDHFWNMKSCTDLRILNTSTGDSEYITDKGRFIASTISYDGKTAAGIDYTKELKYYLKLIDVKSKKVIFSEDVSGNGYLFDPAFSPDGNEIAICSLKEKGNAILIYNLESRKITPLTEYSAIERFRTPCFYGNYIIYTSDYSGIDNIYSIDRKSGKRFQITSRPLGAYFPFVSEDTLIFNDYAVTGYRAASMKLSPKDWTPVSKVARRPLNYIDPITVQELEGDSGKIDDVEQMEYEVKDYYPILHTFNIYGWVPPLDIVLLLLSSDIDITASVYSRDVLMTTDISLSYIHNYNEKTNDVSARIEYSGLYPVITITGSYGERAVYLVDEEKPDNYLTWMETRGSGSIRLPFIFSGGKHSTMMSLKTETGYIEIADRNRSDYPGSSYNISEDGELQYMEYSLSFYSIYSGAVYSVMPGTGVSFNISYYDTPFEKDYSGEMLSSVLTIYLPGLTDMQGLKISGSFEKVWYENYLFPQQFLFPRGYTSLRMYNLYKGSIEYGFPITEFSFNIWKLIYMKRINGYLFYDCGAGTLDEDYNSEIVWFRSAGIELTAESNFFANKYLSLEFGIRYSYCFDYQNNENMDKYRIEPVFKALF